MRSDEVFAAAGQVKNRYLLCSVLRIATRKIHRQGTPLQQTISKVLGLMDERSYRLEEEAAKVVRPLLFPQKKAARKGVSKILHDDIAIAS